MRLAFRSIRSFHFGDRSRISGIFNFFTPIVRVFSPPINTVGHSRHPFLSLSGSVVDSKNLSGFIFIACFQANTLHSHHMRLVCASVPFTLGIGCGFQDPVRLPHPLLVSKRISFAPNTCGWPFGAFVPFTLGIGCGLQDFADSKTPSGFHTHSLRPQYMRLAIRGIRAFHFGDRLRNPRFRQVSISISGFQAISPRSQYMRLAI